MKPIRKMVTLVVMASMFVFLAACNGGSGGSLGPVTNESYSLFPPSYFTNKHLETYHVDATLTGSPLEGNFTIHAGPAKNFNSMDVFNLVKVRTLDAWGMSIISEIENYYTPIFLNSKGESVVYYVGINLVTTGVTYTVTSSPTPEIPLSAKIGDSGDMGTFIGSDGSTVTITWRLEEGDDNDDNLAKLYIIEDSTSQGYSETIYHISPDGSYETFEMSATLSGGALLLTGEKILEE